ncbi:MAG: hypothetical protein RLZZ292_410 [Bacteroidota bacterium]|jgi:hypothetical protein
MKTTFKTPAFKALFALTFLCLFSFFACKKDPVAPTKEELLTAKKWKISALTLTLLSNGTVEDILKGADPCETDDFQKFETNGTMSEDEGATKCSPGDPQSTAGTWAFNTEKTQLTITLDGDKVVTTLVELSATTLKYTFDEDGAGSDKYTVTFTAQ